MIGICGDNCLHCPRYHATKNVDEREMEKVKELWVRLGLRDPAFPTRDMTCSGCRPENKCAYGEVRTCAHAKGLENCGLCQLYPCEMINEVFKETEKLSCVAAGICSTQEMDMLHKAFFSKRQNLDQIHVSNHLNNKR